MKYLCIVLGIVFWVFILFVGAGVISKAQEPPEKPISMTRGRIILYVDPLTQCHFIQLGNDTFMRLDKDLNQIGCR